MTGPQTRPAPALLAEVTRRDLGSGREVVESAHLGALVLTGGEGEILASLGDPEHPTFVRSTAKPFQATACLELLELAGPALSPPEIAVAWASHRGEAEHLQAVRRLLRRSATAPDQLTCPPEVPEADPRAEATRLGHNCSGKHALFALAGATQGTDRARLLDPDGPLQRVVLGLLDEVLGPPLAVGTDGCGAPAVAVALSALARAYGDLAASDRFAAVREAGIDHPHLVGGSGRLESALLAHGIVAKVGAEGVYAAGWRGRDGGPRGVAVKALDGAVRGAAVALVAALEALGIVPGDLWMPPVPLGGGKPAGQVRAADAVAAVAEVRGAR